MEVAPIQMEVAPFVVDFYHFLLIFTIYALLLRFTFCRDLRTFSTNFFWPKQPYPQHQTFCACMCMAFFQELNEDSQITISRQFCTTEEMIYSRARLQTPFNRGQQHFSFKKTLPRAQRAQSIDSINTFISKQKLQQSKHLKGQLDPPVSDGQVFGSKVVSWTPLLVTVTFLDQRLSVGPPNYSIKKSM